MQCQLCIAYGGKPKEIEGTDLVELRGHVREHQSQTNELNEESWKVYSNWCFPNLNLGDDSENSNISKAVTQNLIGTPFNISIKDYFRHILTNCTGIHVQCAICNIRLVITKVNRPGRRLDIALNHAYMHLDQALFSCQHCDYKGKKLASIRLHLNRSHALPAIGEHYEDKSDSHRDQILAILDQCYAKYRQMGSKPADLKPAQRSGDQTITKSAFSTPVSLHCLKLLKTNSKDGRIQCRRCKATVCTKTRCANFFTRPLLDHVARRHLKRNFFQCKTCPYSTPALNSVIAHIRKFHNVRARGHYLDRSMNYETEIIEALSECFGGSLENKGNEVETDERKQTVNADQFRNASSAMCTPGCITEISAAISGYCMKMLKVNARDWKIRCSLCSQDVSVRIRSSFKTRVVISHVQGMHLQLRLYRCKLCQFTSKTVGNMRRHIARIHRVSSIGNYTDQRDKYKCQIMDMIRQCFGNGPMKDNQGKESQEEDGPKANTSVEDGPSTSAYVYAGFIQTNGPLMLKCTTCRFATKHAKLIKNHVANHE